MRIPVDRESSVANTMFLEAFKQMNAGNEKITYVSTHLLYIYFYSRKTKLKLSNFCRPNLTVTVKYVFTKILNNTTYISDFCFKIPFFHYF